MSLVWKHLKADTAALSIAAIDVADRCFAPSRVPTDQRPGKFGIDSADTLSGNVVVALPMDVIRSALKAKVGADRWAQEIDAFKDENGPPIICVQSCCRGSWRGGGGDSPPRQGD